MTRYTCDHCGVDHSEVQLAIASVIVCTLGHPEDYIARVDRDLCEKCRKPIFDALLNLDAEEAK